MNRKKSILIFLIVFIMQTRLVAQLTFMGAAANYGTWIKEPGVSLYIIYSVNDKINLAPNATYFLPHTFDVTDGTHEYTWWNINLDGNYIVLEKSKMQLFGLMGLNFTNEIKRIDELIAGQQPYKDKITTTKPGLNIGAGSQLHLSNFFNPFAGIKYMLGDKHQFVFTLGIVCRIAPDKVPEVTDDF